VIEEGVDLRIDLVAVRCGAPQVRRREVTIDDVHPGVGRLGEPVVGSTHRQRCEQLGHLLEFVRRGGELLDRRGRRHEVLDHVAGCGRESTKFGSPRGHLEVVQLLEARRHPTRVR